MITIRIVVWIRSIRVDVGIIITVVVTRWMIVMIDVTVGSIIVIIVVRGLIPLFHHVKLGFEHIPVRRESVHLTFQFMDFILKSSILIFQLIPLMKSLSPTILSITTILEGSSFLFEPNHLITWSTM